VKGDEMVETKKSDKKADWSKSAIEWARSPKGESELASAVKDLSLSVSNLKKAIVVDNDMLHKAFNL
jgi:hypothetical protein